MHRSSTIEKSLTAGMKELSLPHTHAHIRLFAIYLEELKKWNKTYNLTSIKTDEDIIIKHFLDSLLYLKAVPEGNISVMDVGSGAGFPGIPIKIMRPEIAMYLVEPTRKKASFLRHIISVLKLEDIVVVEKRVEDLESMDVDVAATRALFDIKDFCKKVSPVLERGGMLILSKGPKVNEELMSIEKGLDYRVLALTLPCTDIKRFMVVIKKKTSDREFVKDENVRTGTHDAPRTHTICINAECRLRKVGCKGFEGCPGYKPKNP